GVVVAAVAGGEVAGIASGGGATEDAERAEDEEDAAWKEEPASHGPRHHSAPPRTRPEIGYDLLENVEPPPSSDRAADYVILGAGIAGLTMQHVLRAAGCSAILVDASPGRYKIGESIIPQHFVEPEVRPLYEIVCALPSATPKD